ncbi:serpin E3 [Protobothrops mucrosquamatus]|uniref:serpin E3 n=1 Tax=Protobothrops mucrosquamatus TaxID=103944 RepID=UPI0010FB9CBA|nr:serpin E3 [Protobothrops mucrosquamatus]
MLSLSIASFLLLFCVLNIGSCENHNDLKNLETDFALTLYQKLAERHNGTNLVISPASISFSLGLLQFGARGNTFGQLKHALGYSIHDENVQNFLHTAYKEGINSNQSIIVHLACTLFVQAGMQLSPQFVQQAAWWGNNTVQQSNFSDPNRTKAQIREWITQNTGETSCLSLDTIESPLNQIAVVSTIHFRSTWQRKFSFTHTQALSFTTPDGITLKVPAMYLRAEVNYGEFLLGSLDKISVVEIPYLEEKVSMFVVLPSNRRTSLARTETYFSAQTLSLWSSTLRRTAMDIVLPRFKIQNHLDLKWILPALGITDMFDQTEANFKGISEQEGLYISEVFHKAKIEVTEDGTRASGITAMLLLKRSRAPVFKADRPFNFILRQARTGSILFIGRLTNPTQ